MRTIEIPIRNVANRNGVPMRLNAMLKLDKYFDNEHSALKLAELWDGALVVEAREEWLTQSNHWVTRRVYAVYR